MKGRVFRPCLFNYLEKQGEILAGRQGLLTPLLAFGLCFC